MGTAAGAACGAGVRGKLVLCAGTSPSAARIPLSNRSSPAARHRHHHM
jgi:hypothetical protein